MTESLSWVSSQIKDWSEWAPRPTSRSWATPIHTFGCVESKKTAVVAESADDKGKGKKRVKRDKDAPKKPNAPFFCYQAKRRPQLKAEQPNLKNTEIIKVSVFSRLENGPKSYIFGDF